MVTERTLGKRFLEIVDWPREIAKEGGFSEFTDGDLRGAMMDNNINMLVIRRTQTELFADTVASFIKAQPDTLAIAGCFADNSSFGAARGIKLGSGTLKPGLQDFMGIVVEGGQREGEARPQRAFLVVDGTRRIVIGRGDPPPDALHGFSGLGAMILKGEKIPNGKAEDKGRDEFYRGQSERGGRSGNTIVAIAENPRLIMALVKPHGGDVKLDEIRDKLFDARFTDAVFLDGSDSVFWNLRGAVPPNLVQGEDKNRITTFGLAFLRARINR